MTAPTDPRSELTAAQEAEMQHLFEAFAPPSPLGRAIAEGRARRQAAREAAQAKALEDLGSVPGC